MKRRLSLYRRSGFHTTAAFLVICVCVASMATSFQRRGPHKLRAIGLIEVTRDANGRTSAVLTPITILDNARFQDASIYKSRPQPMAVEGGIVYEAQKTGVPVGYMTVDSGLVKNNIWVAQGAWQPVTQAADRVPSAKDSQAPPSPSGGNSGSGDDRPILHRGTSGSNQPASPPTAPPPASPQTAPTPVPEPEPEPQDPDRPVLRRRKPSAEPSPATTPIPTPTQRPIQRSTTARPQTSSSAPLPNAPGTQIFVGVSDAEPTETRSFEFHWRSQEKDQIEAKMRSLALDQLPGAKTQNNQPVLTNVIIRSFDMDLSNDAVVVLTAEVPGGYLAVEPESKSQGKNPTKTAKTTTPSTPTPKQRTRAASGKTPAADENPSVKFVSRFITVIARIDIEGNPRKLAASVTDSSRLDVAPRLELIDAVDVDGDGLAELLFREYSFDQKSFVVYGIGHGTVTKVFEGASQPLH
jgi:outer membrane biosynthesis protein TonB